MMIHYLSNMEEWKDVVGFEGIYEVSNIGNIRANKLRTINSSKGNKYFKKQVYLKKRFDKDGYAKVCLQKDKYKKYMFIHRIVGISFINNPNNYPCINHINGIKKDNRLENLEWVSFKQNSEHAIKNGYMTNYQKTELFTNEFNIIFDCKKRANDFLGKSESYIQWRISCGKNTIIGADEIEYTIEYI